MKQFLIILSIFLLLVYSIDAQAADKYVRKGASGSGTSWSDAWGDLNNVSWSGMSGSTLWIAAGSYSGQLTTINTPDVTIKRATGYGHGSDTGWNDSYDGQVTVNPSGNFLIINSGADGLTIDGVSNNPWLFRVVGISGYSGMIQNNSADNVTIRNIEMDGNSENPGAANGPEDGFRWYGGSNTVIEHCYIHDYRQVGDEHMDAMQAPRATNLTIRYNIFKNNGMHLFLGDCEWNSSFYVNGFTIHHNVFYNETGIGKDDSYNTIVLKGTNQGGSYTQKIENNTFALRSSEYPGFRNLLYLSAGCNNTSNSYFRNNIVYYSSLGNVSSFSHSYNAYYGGSALSETGRVTSDPLFTSYANNNFMPKSNSPVRDAGEHLNYVEDIIGTAVPQNGTPDIGAYEYNIGESANERPSPPTNLAIIIQ